ncbi:MAG: chemotaxis protein CheB [Chloroflexales bacterium]|nr:chemotaxis protein CheB [Chloroflexales bacterium]
MPERGIVVLGASAGGFAAFRTIVRALPANFPGVLCIVQHLSATGPNLLPDLLGAMSPLVARQPHNGEPIRRGIIYVAPPDQHILFQREHLHVVRGPKENGFWPAIDATLRSAAQAYRLRMIGIVLTGILDNGTAGLLAVKRHGGLALVQDPCEAPYPSMPMSARRYVDVVCPVAEIALACSSSSANGGLPGCGREPRSYG